MSIPFSLVTTCRNEMRSLTRWRQNILEQTRQPDEIVIVDAFSDDGTAEQLREWAAVDPRVKIHQEKGAAAHGRNVAIELASHEHIMSTDMGVRICPEWCEELISPFEKDPSIEVVIGNTCIDVETAKTVAARAELYIEKGGFANPTTGAVGGNRSSAYLKEVWQDLGGLPEDLTFYSDDSVFFRQINQGGYKIAYAPKAMTYWGRHSSLKQFCKEAWNYGRGNGEAMIKINWFFRNQYKYYIPQFIIPFLIAVRIMLKKCSLTSQVDALKNGDFAAWLFMPILSFGQGYNYAKGFIIGRIRGGKECLGCRKRLSTKSN